MFVGYIDSHAPASIESQKYGTMATGCSLDAKGESMTVGLAQLLPSLRSLKRTEKLQVIQFLAGELAHEEDELLTPDVEYPIWSPYDAYEAADVMLKCLKETEDNADA